VVYIFCTYAFWVEECHNNISESGANWLWFTVAQKCGSIMDDIVVKTKCPPMLIQDLEETFANFHRINLKLNPEKCVFGVPSGKLLSFFVSQHGIEANPDRIKEIE
jgi:hypothetical protein